MSQHILPLFILFVVLHGTGCVSNEAVAVEKPNILLILADDLGHSDLGFQGSDEIPTPHLDALAKNGIIFTDAHVTATVCSPSRGGLITGRYQQFFGFEANIPPPDLGLDLSQVTMADVLRDNGYRTAINGKWHLGYKADYHPNSRGFDEFWGFLGGHRSYFPANYREGHEKAIYTNREYTPFTGNYLTDTQGEVGAAFIENNQDQPFFLFMSFAAPHGPIHALEEDTARFPDSDRAAYVAMVYAMDRAVGVLVEKLRETGQLENTVIIFLSDNGGTPEGNADNAPLAGFKGNKFEAGHRVPFFVHWPDRLEGGQSFDGLTSALDLFPTFLAAARIEKPADLSLDGVNLLPFMTGEVKGDPHDMLFFRKEMAAAVRDDKWKLVRLDDYGSNLYDLSEDPKETTDVKNEYPEQFQRMQLALEEWETKTVDPWWSENPAWQEVTRDIHEDLMNHRPIRRTAP
mgnify:CR=1 FL=1